MSSLTKKPRTPGGRGIGWKQVASKEAEQLSYAHLDMPEFASDPTVAQWKARFGINTVPKKGDLYYNTGSDSVKYCSAEDPTTPTWTAFDIGTSPTLQQAFANGKVITGANSSGNAMKVGGSNDSVNIFENASNDVQITTSAGSDLTIAPADDLVLAPTGGDVSITGTLAVSSTTTSTGDLTVGASKLTVTAATGAVSSAAGFTSTANSGNAIVINNDKFLVAAATGNVTVAGDLAVTGTITGTYSVSSLTAASLTFTGTGSGAATPVNVVADNVTTGTVLSLSGDGLTTGKFVSAEIGGAEKYSVGFDGRTTIAGTAAANVFTVTAGDLVVSDGSLTITDADNATTFSVTNNTATSGTVISVTATGVTTGTALAVTTNAAVAGAGKGVSIAMPGMTSGTGLYISAVEATLSTGKYIECHDGADDDFSVARYGATVIAGNAAGTAALTLTNGDAVLSSGRLAVTMATDHASSIVRSVAAAGTAAVLTIQASNAASTNDLLFLNQDGTGAATTLQIDSEGTGDCVTIACKATNASVIKATGEVATGTILESISAASATVSAVSLSCTGTGATGWLGASNVGMAHIVCDGNLAHANASCLYIAYSGTGAASGLGTSIRVVDTGATASSYAVYISAATGEAIKVDAGTCVFDEQIELSGGFKTTTGAFVISDSGAASMDIDGGGANDTLNIGSAVATDVLFHGATAGEDLQWDASADALIALAGAYIKCVGSGTGKGLMIPVHASNSPSQQDEAGAGNIFFEVDANKLWVYNGVGWVGAVFA